MLTTLNPDLATELRYALDVMEEYSHLGLDDEYASKIRDILLRHIEDAEIARSVQQTGSSIVTEPTQLVVRPS